MTGRAGRVMGAGSVMGVRRVMGAGRRAPAAQAARVGRRRCSGRVVRARRVVRAGRSVASLAGVVGSLALAACGGGTPQDAHEPSGSFPVQVTKASFPAAQQLAEHTKLVLTVRNTGTRTIPDVTVTICNVTCSYRAPVGEGTSVAAFAQYLNMPGLANHSRPVWIIDRAPGPCGYSCANGGAGADVSSDANTWQGGSLRPGATATFVWGVTAVAPGRHVVAWEVGASLYGKARAILSNGSTPEGTFTVTISSKPAPSYINPTGQIVQGPG